jgi:DNA polymerase III subunit delta
VRWSARPASVQPVANFKPAYLIHGDDHGRIAERRARLRALAERESGAGGLELLEGDASTPDAAAAAMSAMTFATGRRFVVADGVERWKEGDLEPLVAVMKDPPPDATLALFAREDARTKVPPKLVKLVKDAGGDVAQERTLSPRALPKWVTERAKELDLQLDNQAARALIRHVGDRQQRLLRELEKIALELGPGAKADAALVDELSAASSEQKVWSLGDALVAGETTQATRILLELRAQGESLAFLTGTVARRLREMHDIAARLEAGESVAQVKQSMGRKGFLVDKATRRDADALRRAIEAVADLEVSTRGGGELAEDTAAVLAMQQAGGLSGSKRRPRVR